MCVDDIDLVDINNDNMLDVVIGNKSGGLTLFIGDSAFVSVNDEETEISIIKLYPNPANDELNVDLGDNLIYGTTIQMYDVVGKVMFSQKVSQKILKVDISKFPSGMYFLIYSNLEKRFRAKILKN